MKKFFVLVLAGLMTGCAPVAYEEIEWSKSAFALVQADGEDLYFEYPMGASLGEGFLSYEGCKINYLNGQLDTDRVADKEKGNVEVWYGELGVERYLIDVDFEYQFYLEGEDVSGCIGLAERIANSFGRERLYTNERYGFALPLPKGFEVNYMEDESGLVLSRTEHREYEVEGEKQVDDFTVNIVVAPFDNVQEYEGLNDLVVADYSGYTTNFVEYDGVSGVFVDEFDEGEARRHFYSELSDDVFFEAYLEVMSSYFGEFEGGFKAMVEGMEVK